MVKITEELWNKYDQEIRRNISNDYCTVKEIDYYIEIMKKITGKKISVFDLKPTIIDTTDKGLIDYSTYITDIIPDKYSLTPGMLTIIKTKDGRLTSPFGIDYNEGGGNCSSVKILPMFLYGDDMCVVLYKLPKKSSSTPINKEKIYNSKINSKITPSDVYSCSEDIESGFYISIGLILYTSESIKIAKEIIEDVYNVIGNLPKLPPPPKDTIPVNFIYRSGLSLNIFERDVRISNITLSEFNQDLPDDKIKEELRKDGSGLFIFHGEPGCGKSSYIKYLIGTMKDKEFIVVSQDVLIGNMEEFRTFLLTRCNDSSVIIIEDCENLVKSREQIGSSVVISDFLNITDGIYGDLFRIKFILTFNTEIQKIDSALLRKGRLRCKYKFSKLKGEKLKLLAKDLGIELKESQISVGVTLADLYNYNSEVSVDDNNTARESIGFKK